MFCKPGISRLLSLLVAFSVTACIDSEEPAEATRAGDLRLEAVPPPEMVAMDIRAPDNVTIRPQITGVAYATTIGTAGRDQAFWVAADSAGNAYIAGAAEPCPGATAGALVVKLDPTGAPVYALCFVGIAAAGIAADSAGNAYVGGTSLIKLGPTGAVVYSVGLGQPLSRVAVDASGNAYVVSEPGAPNSDVGVAKVNASGTALLYSVSFGGSNGETPFDIAIDGNGDAYVVGTTASTDFPLSHAIQTSLRGLEDAFVAKLDPTGSLLLYSTYLGGPANDVGTGIAVDNAGSAYITGSVVPQSNGVAGFPVTSGAAQVLQPGGGDDAWVTKLNASGARVYGTYVGGSGLDIGLDIAVDPTTGAAVLTGSTNSTNFPNTTGTPLAGGGDAYVVQLNPAGSAFSFARYLGGTAGDEGFGIATDSSGHVYIAGFTDSPTFPIGGAPNHGGRDACVIKLNP